VSTLIDLAVAVIIFAVSLAAVILITRKEK